MTTIAYRDGVLAADTLSTSGGMRDGYVVKVAKRGPILAAASGSGVYGLGFLDWFRAGMNGDPPAMSDDKDNRAVGHIFLPDGLHLSYWPHGWAKERDAFYADGSGWEVAKGAMSAGASAEEAVRIAIEHDTKSGGEIITLRH